MFCKGLRAGRGAQIVIQSQFFLVAQIHAKAAFISQKKLEDILSHEDLQQVVTRAKWHRRAVGV